MAGIGGWSNKRQLPQERQRCETCGTEDFQVNFPCQRRKDGSLYFRKYCWSCKYSKHDKGKHLNERVKEYQRSYARANRLDLRYKAYRNVDRTKYSACGLTIERDDAVRLMQLPCFYCEASPSHGLDRIDNARGHSRDNVRPCCEKCNLILGDIPDSAKLCLVDGLTKIQKNGYLIEWIIPTKRRN